MWKKALVPGEAHRLPISSGVSPSQPRTMRRGVERPRLQTQPGLQEREGAGEPRQPQLEEEVD